MTPIYSTPSPTMTAHSEIVTESGLRANISVGLRQLAKTIEQTDGASSTNRPPLQSAYEQVTDWLKTHATTYDGRVIDLSWFRYLLAEELDNLRCLIGEQAYWRGKYPEAGRLFNELASRTMK